jgi:pimeloyl-ACP methyl ester carboxylesterase
MSPAQKVSSPDRSFMVNARLPYLSVLKIAVRVQGEGDPLLLINGMTRPRQSWDHLTRLLTGRTVISFDAPGVGDSPTPVRPLCITELATLAAEVLDAAEVPDADILGYSHGGAIAQELAHHAPDRVRTLILAATSCGVGSTPGSREDILRSLGRSLDGQPWPLPDPLGLLWQSLVKHPVPRLDQRCHARGLREPGPGRAPVQQPGPGQTYPGRLTLGAARGGPRSAAGGLCGSAGHGRQTLSGNRSRHRAAKARLTEGQPPRGDDGGHPRRPSAEAKQARLIRHGLGPCPGGRDDLAARRLRDAGEPATAAPWTPGPDEGAPRPR